MIRFLDRTWGEKMKTIIVTSQDEFDSLPESFDVYTVIKIQNTKSRIIVTYKKNSSVVAWDNSSVEAWDNSSVVAWGNSSVEAWGNSISRIMSSGVRLSSHQFSVSIIQQAENVAVTKCDDTAQVVYTKAAKDDLKSFMRAFRLTEKDGTIRLYKIVQNDCTDFWSGKIKYQGHVVCPDWYPGTELECGSGLHLSATVRNARAYQSGGKILLCEVRLEDIAVYPYNISKVRCRAVTVIGECDEKGKLID